MKRPGGERAASGSSSSRTAARHPCDHESRKAPWRLREQSTGKPPRKGHEHSDSKALRRCRRARRCTACGLPSAAPAAGGYSVPRPHSTAPRSDRPRTKLRGEGLRHPCAKTVKLFRRGSKALGALMGAKRAGSASRWRVQRATSAQHSSAKRPSAHRALSRGPSASIRKDREAEQTRTQSAKGPHGRKESATSGSVVPRRYTTGHIR